MRVSISISTSKFLSTPLRLANSPRSNYTQEVDGTTQIKRGTGNVNASYKMAV